MSAKYDFYLTPQPKDKQDKVRYHARVVIDRTLSTEDITEEIAKRGIIKKAIAKAVLDEAADIIQMMMKDGYAVKLDGIGSLRISAKSPAVRSKREIRAESIKFGGVVFKPEKRLLRKLKNVKFEKVEYSQNSSNISEIEIDGKLTDYFKDHAYITTKEMQYLCGLSNHTALRRLKERVEAGKLIHPGHLRSAFYFPVPGNYGISRNS